MKNKMIIGTVTALSMLILSSYTKAESVWTDYRQVGVVYSYTAADTLYVYLEGETCQNAKNYYSIVPEQTSNAKQLISMVLTAKASKRKVRIYHDDSVNTTLCYFKGLMIE